jgi:hypothetical protein
MRPGDLDPSGLGEVVQAAGGRVPVHPGAAAVEQDRSARAVPGCPVDGPPDCWRQRYQDDLGALAAHAQDPATVFFAEVGDVRAGASKIRRPSSPGMATSAKSHRFGDWRAAVSSASNCRWVNPSVGDSAGTEGRRTCSEGECSKVPSMTQVR